MRCLKLIVLTVLTVFPVRSLMANDWSDHCVGEITADARRDKIREVNLAGFGVITVWGVAKWDYFSGSFRTSAEGWFQNDTRSGGADKLGHLYTSYVTAHGLSGLYEYACFSKNDAAFYGALSSFAITAYMELGDSFSNFGFSNEDLVANALGSVLGYYLYKDPGLSSKIDLRWEYGFHPEGNDFTTDYENSKYLVALKLNGFAAFRHSFLKHFELQLGYYTRGFSDVVETNERNLFIGIGLNLTDLFRRHGYTKTATLLNYLQVPGANIEFEHDLNR